MNKHNYTSLKFSKWLENNGCKFESNVFWINDDDGWILVDKDYWETVDGEWGSCRKIRTKDKCVCAWCTCGEAEDCTEMMGIRAYDILNDICVEYAEEFWGGLFKSCAYCGSEEFNSEGECEACGRTDTIDCTDNITIPSTSILLLLQKGQKKMAENHIELFSLFNKKNK